MQASNGWLALSTAEQLEILKAINEKMNISVSAIEKDWWVTQTLRLIFEMDIAPHIVFKGGTSLSKAWSLIERFSEDIDLALDRRFLGFNKPMTGSQVNKLRKVSFQYISDKFFPQLKNAFDNAGIDNVKIQLAAIKDADQDPLIIEIYYPSLSGTNAYIQPRVLVEIGSRSLIEPFTKKSFTSLVGEHFANRPFADSPITVAAVNPERTLLEKIFLLHEEFQKPFEKIRVDRLSRHLYDIEKMMDTSFKNTAFEGNKLYDHIVEHRRTLTPVRGIDYSRHSPDKINFIPPPAIIAAWQKDYEAMQESMIYGESLSFTKLMQKLRLLNDQVNAIQFK